MATSLVQNGQYMVGNIDYQFSWWEDSQTKPIGELRIKNSIFVLDRYNLTPITGIRVIKYGETTIDLLDENRNILYSYERKSKEQILTIKAEHFISFQLEEVVGDLPYSINDICDVSVEILHRVGSPYPIIKDITFSPNQNTMSLSINGNEKQVEDPLENLNPEDITLPMTIDLSVINPQQVSSYRNEIKVYFNIVVLFESPFLFDNWDYAQIDITDLCEITENQIISPYQFITNDIECIVIKNHQKVPLEVLFDDTDRRIKTNNSYTAYNMINYGEDSQEYALKVEYKSDLYPDGTRYHFTPESAEAMKDFLHETGVINCESIDVRYVENDVTYGKHVLYVKFNKIYDDTGNNDHFNDDCFKRLKCAEYPKISFVLDGVTTSEHLRWNDETDIFDHFEFILKSNYTFKNRISKLVKDATGEEVTISQEIGTGVHSNKLWISTHEILNEDVTFIVTSYLSMQVTFKYQTSDSTTEEVIINTSQYIPLVKLEKVENEFIFTIGEDIVTWTSSITKQFNAIKNTDEITTFMLHIDDLYENRDFSRFQLTLETTYKNDIENKRLLLLRKNNSSEITAYHDAMLTYSALGDGYLVRAYQGLECSFASGIITITSGVILFGGRIVEIPKGGSLELDVSSIQPSQIIYVILTVTIRDNDANSDCSITAVTSRPTESNPIAGVGTHKKVLFTLSANGRSITRNIEGIEPGVAKNALNLLPTGKIASKGFWEIFLDDMSGVRYAKNADVAAEAQGFVGGDINKVSANLYMPNRGVYLLQEAVLVNETTSITLQPNESKIFTRNDFPILQGRNKTALLISTTKQDNLTIESIPDGLVGGTPTQFIFQNLTFTIYEKNELGKGNVKVANTTDQQITIQGLHIKFIMYGGQ